MSMKDKLTSRKFWAMVIGVILGIGISFGVDEGTVSTVAGSMTSIISLITYIIVEGRIDAAALTPDIIIEGKIELEGDGE